MFTIQNSSWMIEHIKIWEMICFLGVAYVRGACLSAPFLRGNAFNFGIGEASTSFNGIIIAAHEVGHL